MLVAEKSGKFFNSRVFHKDNLAIKTVLPKTPEAEDMLFLEHDILLDFSSEHIVKPVDYRIKDGVYILTTEWVETLPITDPKEFADGLHRILEVLEDAEVSHRDIRVKNIIPHGNTPVLIDFGWAHRWKDSPALPDSELVNPNDRQAMNEIIKSWESEHSRPHY